MEIIHCSHRRDINRDVEYQSKEVVKPRFTTVTKFEFAYDVCTVCDCLPMILQSGIKE